MSRLSLDFEKIDDNPSEFIIFHDADLRLTESLHLPTIIRFHRADKFDSKLIQTSNDVWSFSYSGIKLHLNFSNFSTAEKKLAKFFLANYIQVNTPSALEAKLQAYTFAIKSLKTRSLKLDYQNAKSLLIDLAKDDNSTYYYHFKFLVKLLFLENFSCFDLDQEYELEFLERPKAFNSRLYYQQYEDAIDYPLISMIQQGFIKLNQAIKDDFQGVDKQTLLMWF